MEYKVRRHGIIDGQMLLTEEWFETLDEARAYAQQTDTGVQADIHDADHGLIETVKN